MNGEIPSVPITTLAGVASLTDLLPQLPLPTPLPSTVSNNSLLFDPSIADEGRRLLATKDDNLVAQLVQTLGNTSTESIELKDVLATDAIEGEMPELLKAVLTCNPNAFKGTMPSMAPQSFDNVDHSRPVASNLPHTRQPMTPQFAPQTSPYAAGHYSPFPPSSPTRYPSQSPKYPGTNNSHSQHGSPYSQQQPPTPSAPQFSNQFQKFGPASKYPSSSGSGVSPTGMPVNGGMNINSSPSGSNSSVPPHISMSPPQVRTRPSSQPAKPATVSSPAQATSAPLTPEIQRKDPSIPHHMPPQSSQQFHTNSQPVKTENTGDKSSEKKPERPVIRGVNPELDMNLFSSPVIKLTRIDDPLLDEEHSRLKIKRKRNKSNKDEDVYQVISSKSNQSDHRLTLKLSKRQICANESPISPYAVSSGADIPQSVPPDLLSTVRVPPSSKTNTDDGVAGLHNKNNAGSHSKTTSSHDQSRHKSNKTVDINNKRKELNSSSSSAKTSHKLSRSNERSHHHHHHNSSLTIDAKIPADDAASHRKRKRSVDTDSLPEDVLHSIAGGGSGRTYAERIGEFTASLSERVKRRRRTVLQNDVNDDDSNFENEIVKRSDSPEPPNKETAKEKEKKLKRRERDKSRMVVLKPLTTDELMESGTFKRFVGYVDEVIESTEDLNLANMEADEDEGEVPNDVLVARSLVADICSEAAKLKSVGVMKKIPRDKLIKLMTVLQWNIKDACRLIPCSPHDGDADDDQLWRELTLDRVNRSIDAALISLYIMTSPNMPKQVYIDDVIDRCVMLIKFQLTNSVYPEYDPVYRTVNKDYHGSLKAKRARASQVKSKSVLTMYNKLTELVGILADLVELQELTDTVVLQISSLGVSPFFVENVSELQLSAIKLVTTVFSRYEKHRTLIIEDIFASLARLPSSKRNLRSFRLSSEESIQMVTALVLQLMQCVVQLPKIDQVKPGEEVDEKKEKKDKIDRDVMIVTSYEVAMRSGHSFLSVFLRKCAIKGEDDFRPLFENFVQDLLTTVNKPEWPAAELLLSLLGRLLVQQFSNKSVDMSLRVASLDYLGIVASRLRKDAVSSHLNHETLEEIMEQINESEDEGAKTKSIKDNPDMDHNDKTQVLQKLMLEYLAHNAASDPCYHFARQFNIAQWYRDSSVQAEKVSKNKPTPEKWKKKSRRKTNSDDDDADNSEDEPDDADDEAVREMEKTKELLDQTEKRKRFMLSQVKAYTGSLSTYKSSRTSMDYDHACWVSRYLASNRPFSQSFDIYLTQILKVLCETAVAVRTKAMKCLTSVVEADPSILARPDMQRGVHGRFLDQSTSVREAAVELVGKFILIRPELINQYYDMLSERILDTGISVRKRVIKIFRDICLEQPEFPKIPEMCVRMIRRVNDEEGIKKLVSEVFQNMWFTPTKDRSNPDKLVRRVINISEVVSACRDTGYEWLEQLIEALLKKEDDQSQKPVLKACQQIVDCLVENVLSLEEQTVDSSDGKKLNHRLVACMATLHLFSKVRPDLLIEHSMTLQPYLNIKCMTQSDYMVIHYVARILEVAVPMMEHPSESFLAQLEEDMMKLILKHGMMVLQSCVSCLGAVVNTVSHNYKLVTDCFQKFFGVLSRLMNEHKQNPTSQWMVNSRPTLLRSLFTVGLLCMHFDFDSKEMGEAKISIRDRVFEVLMHFTEHEDEDIRHKALSGLGFYCIRHYETMMGTRLKEYYISLLTRSHLSVRLGCQVLKNLQNYLLEEEIKMIKSDHEWKKHAKSEDLKEMGDIQSGMASTVMQVYLKYVLESFFDENLTVRSAALSVICLVLRQGLVHPVQCVPYLVSMGTDGDQTMRAKADQQLSEIEKKYPGFIQMKALAGIKMSYQLQQKTHSAAAIIRGCRDVEPCPQSLNSFLYSVVRGARSQRRALLSSMLNLFDDTSKCMLSQLLFMADNIAYFPYQVQDEPLFIIHQIDILVSVSGSNLVQSFREIFFPEKIGTDGVVKIDEDEEEDSIEALLARLPADVSPIQDLCQTLQGCILLLVLKQHLKEMYGFTDNKIHRYSPNDGAKINDKPVTRRPAKFDPKQVIDVLNQGTPPTCPNDNEKRLMIEEYLDFKYLMMSIDPVDEDSDDGGGGGPTSTGRHTPVAQTKQESQKAASDNPESGEQTAETVDNSESNLGGSTYDKHHISHNRQNTHQYVSKHRHLLMDKKRSHHGSTGSGSGSRRPKTSAAPSTTPISKPRKKKKKRRVIVSDEESDDDDEDSDPDFVC
ncbi:nipped-B-like protein A isoform X2 [Tubulanus polymorphus]|uniref:nipped-B-like protein A isoform X2 n=1 Tax=Tubulanus polymorphus TaxID=672921 RepID=UPI003DA3950F